LAAGIAAALVLTLASPASALKAKYVQKLEIAGADSITGAVASCPARFQVVGGGAFSNGAFSETKILSSFPVDGNDDDNKADDAWRATLWNTAPSTRNIESQAICTKAKPRYRSQPWTMGVTAPPRVKCPQGTKPSGAASKRPGPSRSRSTS
jgi:hypothetical protein